MIMKENGRVVHRRESKGWNSKLSDIANISCSRKYFLVYFQFPECDKQRRKSIRIISRLLTSLIKIMSVPAGNILQFNVNFLNQRGTADYIHFLSREHIFCFTMFLS
jgi:hypothetical protein